MIHQIDMDGVQPTCQQARLVPLPYREKVHELLIYIRAPGHPSYIRSASQEERWDHTILRGLSQINKVTESHCHLCKTLAVTY